MVVLGVWISIFTFGWGRATLPRQGQLHPAIARNAIVLPGLNVVWRLMAKSIDIASSAGCIPGRYSCSIFSLEFYGQVCQAFLVLSILPILHGGIPLAWVISGTAANSSTQKHPVMLSA